MFIKNILYKITNPKKYHEYKIDINVKKKIRATNIRNFKPYVTLHDKKFILN